jgi:hypothetical protein
MYQPWAYKMRAININSRTPVPVHRYAVKGTDLSRYAWYACSRFRLPLHRKGATPSRNSYSGEARGMCAHSGRERLLWGCRIHDLEIESRTVMANVNRVMMEVVKGDFSGNNSCRVCNLELGAFALQTLESLT